MTSSVLHGRPAVAKPAIPPLRNGDHLSRDEFERRYEAMAGVNKAELIEGVVHIPSPCCRAIWPAFWQSSSRDWPAPNTPRSWPVLKGADRQIPAVRPLGRGMAGDSPRLSSLHPAALEYKEVTATMFKIS